MKRLFITCLSYTFSLSILISQNITDGLLFHYDCNGNLNDLSINGINATTNAKLSEDADGNQESRYLPIEMEKAKAEPRTIGELLNRAEELEEIESKRQAEERRKKYIARMKKLEKEEST